jgi:hypothetical protein
MTDDLDMRDLGEVLRRGVLPVTRALFQPGELTGIDVYLVGQHFGTGRRAKDPG